MQRVLVILVAVLLAASVAGLFLVDDDEPPAPTPAEFQAAGNVACDRFTARVTAGAPPADAIADFRQALEDLGAPVGRTEAFDRLVENLRAAESDPDDATPLVSAATTAVELGLTRCVVFDAAKRRAQDRLAQSEIRNAFAAEKVVYTDLVKYTEDLDLLREIEPALMYAVGSQPAETRTVYVRVARGFLYVSARSEGGRCYYLRDSTTAGTGPIAFASDVTCGPAEGQQYSASW
jgi:hypothetical protein